jgi:hypothetical protein
MNSLTTSALHGEATPRQGRSNPESRQALPALGDTGAINARALRAQALQVPGAVANRRIAGNRIVIEHA